MSDLLPPDLDIYALLQIPSTATDAEIRRAYRKQSLILHPDKNKSPTAAQDFHRLKLAFDVLVSPTARTHYDNLRKAKAAKAERTAKYDDKRRQMQKDLEEAEQASSNKRRKVDVEEQERLFVTELAKLREESERLKREWDRKVEEELARQEEERVPDNAADADDDGERTVKVKFWKGIDRGVLTADLLDKVFSRYGEVENVLLGKSALVVFRSVDSAEDCVARILKSGDPIVSMIKEVTLSSPKAMSNRAPPRKVDANKSQEPSKQTSPSHITTQSAPPPIKFSFKASTTLATDGVDYESITLMRMRKIEKERLEREIRDREAREDMEGQANVS
jgi:DnaJ homolog subfamily C member 17